MGERDPAFKQALRGEPDRQPTIRGLRSAGLRQSLQKEGIIRGQIADARADDIDDFVAVFDKSDVLKPTQRTILELAVASITDAEVTMTVEAAVNEIIVIRKLSWSFSGDIPDSVEVRFQGAQATATAIGPILFHAGPFPVSDLVIGDVSSPLTKIFQTLLPISILPKGKVVLVQSLLPIGQLIGKASVLIETHYSPFRPAGL